VVGRPSLLIRLFVCIESESLCVHTPILHLDQISNAGKLYETSVPAGPSPPPQPISFRSLHSMGVSDELYRHYRNLSLECIRQMDPSDPQHKAIPLPYCNSFCLDNSIQQKRRGRSSFGYPTSTFQVTNRDDGHLYCLKRFDSVRSVSSKIAQQVTDRWSMPAINEHPGIVPFHQCFMTHRAVFFVYQYIQGARTFSEYVTGPLAESIVWSCISQLVSAIRVIHGNDLAVRTLRLKQCLCTTDSSGTRLRIRIGGLGIVDALEFEARKHVIELQIEDIRDLGRLILSLASGTEINSTSDATTIGQCEQFLMQNYSRELHNLCMTLIRAQPRPPTIIDVARATAIHSFDEQDAIYKTLDRTERALSSEYESGRALRLLLKLNFINERPELGPNRRWAQSGDCYILNLFRDFGNFSLVYSMILPLWAISSQFLAYFCCFIFPVFHQADGGGYPVMDLGHVITSLNKLDAADEEKIVLASRDGKTLLVVSYSDVSRCLEGAFQELCSNAVSFSSLQY
jgi:PAB-dependent poly(A)-specific ribonuclease subunit 3